MGTRESEIQGKGGGQYEKAADRFGTYHTFIGPVLHASTCMACLVPSHFCLGEFSGSSSLTSGWNLHANTDWTSA